MKEVCDPYYPEKDFVMSDPQKPCRECGEFGYHKQNCFLNGSKVEGIQTIVLDSQRVQTDRCEITCHDPSYGSMCWKPHRCVRTKGHNDTIPTHVSDDFEGHSQRIPDQPVAPETIFINGENDYKHGVWTRELCAKSDIEYRRVETCVVTRPNKAEWRRTGCGEWLSIVDRLKFCGFCGGRIEIT